MRAPFWWEDHGILSTALLPFAALYARAAARRRHLTTPIHAKRPVICIGNLVAGGAGKTPAALALALSVKKLGFNPHFLTRGYGGALGGPILVDPQRHGFADVGDEALLLARVAPTWVSRNRPEGTEAAAQAGADVIIMDDGLQNPSLAHDLDIVVIDGAYGFGNGRLMPAGPLRETLHTARPRLDLAIIIGPDRHNLAAVLAQLPIARAWLEPVGAAVSSGEKVMPFAGIGRPQKFFDTLAALGCEIGKPARFADHHAYSTAEIRHLKQEAGRLSARLVTTEKDWVRIPEGERASITALPVRLAWENDAEALIMAQLRSILVRRSPP